MDSEKKDQWVYISSQPGSNISSLILVFQRLGYGVLNSIQNVTVGETFQGQVNDYIQSADLVCAVFHRSESSNVFFDIGLARGYNKPTIIISPNLNFTAQIPGTFFINTDVNDTKALEFQISTFLENKFLDDTKQEYQINTSSTRNILWAEKEKRQNFDSKLEKKFWSYLTNSREFSVPKFEPREMTSSRYIPDFAVWPNEKHLGVRGPLFIEIKGFKQTKSGLKNSTKRLIELLNHSHGGAAILLVQDPKISDITVEHLFPLVFSSSIEHAEKLINKNQLMKQLALKRNQFAHSVNT